VTVHLHAGEVVEHEGKSQFEPEKETSHVTQILEQAIRFAIDYPLLVTDVELEAQKLIPSREIVPRCCTTPIISDL